MPYLRSEGKWAFNWDSQEDLKFVSCPRRSHNSHPRLINVSSLVKVSMVNSAHPCLLPPNICQVLHRQDLLSPHTLRAFKTLQESQELLVQGYTASGIYVKVYVANDSTHIETKSK